MGKRKLSNKQIIDIAKCYANGSDAVNTTYLSSKYGVSKSTISNALHYAISNCLVNEKAARLIADKAIRHEKVTRETLGYPESKKVSDLYDKLLLVHVQRSQNNDELPDLKTEYLTLRNLLDTYDETFSSSDEFPYSKEELIEKVELLEDKIKQIESTLK